MKILHNLKAKNEIKKEVRQETDAIKQLAFFSLEKAEASDNTCCKRKHQTYLMYMALFLSAIIITLILCTYQSPDIRFDSEEVSRLVGPWTIEACGNTVTANLPFKTPVPAGETVRYSVILPEIASETGFLYNSIMFRALHEYARIYIEDQLLYEFGYDQSTLFGQIPNNGWLIVRLPSDFVGQKLIIETTGYYDNGAGDLSNVYLGTKNALVFFILNSCLPIIFINFCIILISTCLLLTSFFFKQKIMVYQLRYLSVFSLITGVWLLLESGGYQLFMGKPVLSSNFLFIVFTLIPIAFIRFLLTYDYFKDSRYMNILYYISFGGCLLIHLLQLTHIMNYYKSIFITHIIMVLAIGAMIKKYAVIILHKEKITEKALFISCLILCGFGSIDILRFYLGDSTRPTLFSQIGLFFYFSILCYFAIQKIAIEKEKNISKMYYEKMAYMDILTNLPNRNAFESEMNYYRNKPQYQPLFMVLDLNELKLINDNYGHLQGDRAIIQIGNILKECFSDKSHIFRIGGDEFCVISSELLQEEITDRIEHFHQIVSQKADEVHLPLTVAVGWSKQEESVDIDKVLHAADTNMYINKRQMKENT